MAANINAEHTSLPNFESSWSISLLRRVFIVKVLDRAHQVPLAVERQCRPRTSGVENLDCDPRRQLHGLQSNADLGQAFATLESFAAFATRGLNRDSNVNAAIFEQSFDNREVAVLRSASNGVAVLGRRIDARVVQQSFDDREVAALSCPSHSVVVVGRRIDALVLQQSFDDRDVAVMSSISHGEVVARRRIDTLILQQSFDNIDVAVLSSPTHGVVVVGRRIDALVLQQSFDDREVATLSSQLDRIVVAG
jgi:limonene-1,2-epoxide hydrolase